MAKIIAGLTTSHIPAIGNAIAGGLEQDEYWKRFFDGYEPVKKWLDEVKPDLAIVVYNDHGLNFFLNQVPTFAMGCADQYQNADEGWGIPVLKPFQGDAAFSWHVAEKLINQGVDMCTCQEMKVDHGFTVPMQLFWRHHGDYPLKTLPFAVNTVQHPLPSARRCYEVGQALRTAVESYPEDMKVVIIGTGGLSHQLQGERSGLIDVEYDIECINSVIENPEWLCNQSNSEIMEKAGTEGIEVIMWMVMRGALPENVNVLHKHYHAPISNTGSGVLLLTPQED